MPLFAATALAQSWAIDPYERNNSFFLPSQPWWLTSGDVGNASGSGRLLSGSGAEQSLVC